MTDFLVKRFVKDYEKTDDIKVREKYGMLSSVTGIVCNILLFVIKYLVGFFTSSIAIISDAFNNLSDSASCIITMIGYKAAAKPSDKDHPFGHGRVEYLTSLVISFIILLVGFELLRNSFIKLFNPEELKFSVGAVISLVVSIGIKFWMSVFNKKLGKRINSSVMLATSEDSRNDVVSTLAALVGLISSLFTKLPVDAVMGILVSLFIIKGGYDIVKETVDHLIGKPADPALVKKINDMLIGKEKIIGVHDLIVHDYGPGNMLASCHAEVSSNENIVIIHELIDACERDIYDELGIIMTIHTDPVDDDNEQVNELRHRMNVTVKNIDERMSIHDFRITSGEYDINMIFDVVVPFDLVLSNDEIKKKIDSVFEGDEVKYHTVITFDRTYIES